MPRARLLRVRTFSSHEWLSTHTVAAFSSSACPSSQRPLATGMAMRPVRGRSRSAERAYGRPSCRRRSRVPRERAGEAPQPWLLLRRGKFRRAALAARPLSASSRVGASSTARYTKTMRCKCYLLLRWLYEFAHRGQHG